MKKQNGILKIPALAAAAFLAGVCPVAAGDNETAGPDPRKVFARKDTDKNGFLSKEEYTAKAKDPAKAEKRFEKSDTDKDGALSLEEFIEGRRKKDSGPGKKSPAN